MPLFLLSFWILANIYVYNLQMKMFVHLLSSLLILVALNGISTVIGAENPILASRGGVSISLEDVDAYMDRIPESKRSSFMNSPKRIQAVLNLLLLNRQLAQEMKAQGLDKAPEFSQFSGISLEEKLAEKRLEELAKVDVPDLETLAQETYLSRKKDYILRGKMDVQHIVISRENRTEEEAKALAEKVRTEALANPQAFTEHVEKFSDAQDKKESNGLLKDVISLKVEIPIKEAAEEFRDGKTLISSIKPGAEGYHILKLVNREPDYQQTYEDVHDKLLTQLKKNYTDQYRKNYVNKLTNQFLEANPDLVASLRARYLPPGEKLPEDIIREMEDKKKQSSAEAPELLKNNNAQETSSSH